MSVFLQPIATYTASTTVSPINFLSIPQTYTDLFIKISGRSNNTSYDNIQLQFNSDNTTSNYSNTNLYGDGSGTFSERTTSSYIMNFAAGSLPNLNSTSNTFGNMDIYISNYTSSNYKSIIVDNSAENNSAATYVRISLGAGLWRNTSAINAISLFPFGSFVQYTKVSLYGVLRQGI